MVTRASISRVGVLLGPAFVAAIAYVDPGNFAANFSAGAEYGYMLVWVLVAANIMAALVQYLSAKIGIATGKTMPEIVAEKLPRSARIMYWAQAELVAIACDIAEIIGGAIALQLLFNIPLVTGGLITAGVSFLLLAVYRQGQTKYFERMIVGLLLIIPIGFIAGLIMQPPEPLPLLAGLVPRFSDADSVLLATAMLGATIMPHVVYLHSALTRDKHGKISGPKVKAYLKATRIDVVIAMLFAGTINLSMVVLAASALQGQPQASTLNGVYSALGTTISPVVATLFAVGLLIAGFASTAVGSQAGAIIMQGLLKRSIPLFIRRLITVLPAIAILIIGVEPTTALIVSQVGLSFGVPFALLPLARITASKNIMGSAVNHKYTTIAIYAIAGLVSLLNFVLIILTITG